MVGQTQSKSGHKLEPCLGSHPPWLGGRMVLGEPLAPRLGDLLPVGLQILAPKDKAGLCSFKELWFKESRCPRMVGPWWVVMTKPTPRLVNFPFENGTLKHHPLPCEAYTCSETTGSLGQSQGSPDCHRQTQMREEEKQPQP